MSKAKPSYGNESISSLKGADRVRKRPGVIFGSDGLEGCEHAVFEILSNAIDEAREGYGRQILVTRYEDHSIEVEDFGRGCPVDWNEKEGKYNWELVFCELYAGGKYQNNAGGDYEFSLGLNGLGSCATQYSSEYFDATIRRDGASVEVPAKDLAVGQLMLVRPGERIATDGIVRPGTAGVSGIAPVCAAAHPGRIAARTTAPPARRAERGKTQWRNGGQVINE